jgi:hypothetical protein
MNNTALIPAPSDGTVNARIAEGGAEGPAHTGPGRFRTEAGCKANHVRRLEQGTGDPQAGVLFVEILHNLERIGDHAANIAGDVLLI